MASANTSELFQTIQRLRMEHNNAQGSREQRWIQAHLTDSDLCDAVSRCSVVAFHILSALEKQEQTGIELAEQLDVTRGGISRAAKKLTTAGLVQTEKHPDNQKEIYYVLTAKGRELAAIHDQMHQAIKCEIVDRLTAKYSPAELKLVNQFLSDLLQLEEEFK
ncbi:MarR family winged helix-turn-helix transcriptional regulator [Limosilactobacillus difficilis]|uniref:MarR family winged helix-turn-helix transcriptional regulator n=1 Tax=Limosilactobacillus difficilis TaxID=2991838 RepID=UPI0024BB6587|nr:MarR family transcriptional regulator [Limosilactobacillus difficilis]